MTNTSKNYETLRLFMKYCHAHPEQRFWQALRNWVCELRSGKTCSVCVVDMELWAKLPENSIDTFYIDGAI